MSRRAKLIGSALVICATAAAAVFWLTPWGCPASGLGVTPAKRSLARLKNRDTLPRPSDRDGGVTLVSLLQPGDDRSRWSEQRAAVVEGYVVEVQQARPEAANCFSPVGRDTHIHLALRADAPLRETLVLEVTPRMERRARALGRDWSAAALKRDLTGRLCRFEGWLLFDREHAEEAQNTAPGAHGNWRATAWELHPVTHLEVLGR